MSATITAFNGRPRPSIKDATLHVSDIAVPVTATPVLAVTAVGVAYGIGLLIGAAVR
jgi:hypothetical protein